VTKVNIPGYTIGHRIGTGGQAMVYEAVQDSLRRRVALKVLNPVLSVNSEFTERFLNEGRILANLNHSNAITIYDIGVVEDLHYLSMELVQGGDLIGRMRRGLAPEITIDYLAIIADCLGAAHERQVVHRDIKPGNVLFRRDGTLLLTDFGIAKLLGDGDALTLTGTTLGSPSYLSPEQAQNRPLDGRADIYSLGAMAFEMLSGRKPYSGDSEFATIHCHLTAPVPQLPEAHSAFQPLIERMMAKSPDDRFANTAELIGALRALRPEIPVRPRAEMVQEVLHADAGEPTPPTMPRSGLEPTLPEGDEEADATTRINPAVARRPRRLRRRGLAAAAGLVLGLAAGGVYLGHLRADRDMAGDEVLGVASADTGSAAGQAGDSPAAVMALDGSSAPEASDGASIAAAGSPVAFGAGEAPAPPESSGVAVVESAPSEPPPTALVVTEELSTTPVVAEEPAAAAPVRAEEPPARPQPGADGERVAALLASAQEAMDDLRLTRPQERSAKFYYDQVLSIEPDNQAARDGHRAIAQRYAGLAESALTRGDSDRARALIARGLSVDEGNTRLLALAEEAKAARAGRGRGSMDTAAASSDGIQGESPQQLYRRIKGWFN
jgi:serine/threonine-protein kinase PpkA